MSGNIISSFDIPAPIVERASIAGQIDYIIQQYLAGHYEEIPARAETVQLWETNLEAIAEWKACGCPEGAMRLIAPYAGPLMVWVSMSMSLTGVVL